MQDGRADGACEIFIGVFIINTCMVLAKGWTQVGIRAGLIKRVREELAEHEDLTSASMYVDLAIREKLLRDMDTRRWQEGRSVEADLAMEDAAREERSVEKALALATGRQDDGVDAERGDR